MPPLALEDCEYGLFHADCGGSGSAALACNASGDCRWFAGGLLADGYIPTDCPVADVCCHPSGVAEFDWPYASWAPPADSARIRMREAIQVLEHAPVVDDSAAFSLPITFDVVAAPPTPSLTCSDVSVLGGCPAIGTDPRTVRVTREVVGSSRVLIAGFPEGFGGRRLIVELYPASSGEVRARFFRSVLIFPEAPVGGGGIETICVPGGHMILDASGRVVLAPGSLDVIAGAHGVIDLAFDAAVPSWPEPMPATLHLEF